MSGPWSTLGNPSNNHNYHLYTQGSHIEKLPGADPPDVEKFLCMGDRYEPYINTKEGSRYIFLKLEVHEDGNVKLFPDQPSNGTCSTISTSDTTSASKACNVFMPSRLSREISAKGLLLDCCTDAPSHEKKEEFKICHSVKQDFEDQNHGIVGVH